MDVRLIVREGLRPLPSWIVLWYLLLFVRDFNIVVTYESLPSFAGRLLRKSPVLAMSTVLFHIEREDQLVVRTIHETVEVEGIGLMERTILHFLCHRVATAIADLVLLAHIGDGVLQILAILLWNGKALVHAR